jgi:hypothetical protein
MTEIIVTHMECVPEWLCALGLRVPEDVGVVFIDTRQQSWKTGIDILPGKIDATAVIQGLLILMPKS